MECKNPESKETDWFLKSKGTNWLLIIFLGILAIAVVFWLIPDISKAIFSPANQNKPKKISSSSYKKELKEAEVCINMGLATMMENYLIKAKWDAREKGVDISEQVKEMYARGSLSVIRSALSKALYGHKDSARHNVIRYKRFCSEAEIQPDDEKIEEIEMIIRRN